MYNLIYEDFKNRDGLNSKEDGDLVLFDYSQEIQCNFDWDLISLNARGIVFDKVTGKLVARSFPKFFNFEELNGEAGDKLPIEFQPNINGPFDALDKKDGSCGIVYNHADIWRVNTRGSFYSDQAVWGKKWFDENIRTEHMEPGKKTYIFEIIYPENRIVVDYGKKEMLVLLAIIDNETGEETGYHELNAMAHFMGCEVTERIHFDKFEDIFTAREKLSVNEEGWVVTFDNGYKCKIKGEEYLKVHRILSSVTPLHFWRAINLENFDMPDIEETILMLPDEFQDAAKDLVKITIEAHQGMLDEIIKIAKTVPEFPDDKQGKKDTFFWIKENVKPDYLHFVLNYLSGNHSKLRESIHRRCRPTLNSYDNIKVDPDMLKRLKRILDGGN